MVADERWNEVRRLLASVNPTKIIASLFAHTPLDPIPLDSQVLHVALLRLKKQNEKFAALLDDFIFTVRGPFPRSSELDSAIPRLAMARLISIPNPDYETIVVNDDMRERILEQEREWFGGDPAKIELLERMGKQFCELLKDRQSELKKREAELVAA